MSTTARLLFVLLIVLNRPAFCQHPKATPDESPRFFYKGLLISDCTIPGERTEDGVKPGNAVCWQLSKTRYIWVYQTKSFQGADSVRAIVYQIRKDRPDGPILKEAVLSPFTDHWDPFGRGDKYFKQQGHAKVFGVPKGAVDKNGKLLPSNNVFCAGWYQHARIVDHATGRLLHTLDERSRELSDATQRIATIQFKLNEAEDDIELLTPITILRQKGFETGDAFCELGPTAIGVNQWYTPYSPYDEECTQWVDVRHFLPDGLAAVMMEFDPKTRRYEWTKTGPLATMPEQNLIEASLNRIGDEWIVGARPNRFSIRSAAGPSKSVTNMGWEGCAVWFRRKDLFAGLGDPIVMPGRPAACRSSYVCPDGVLRVFGGDKHLSPYNWPRNPVYCWDVDPSDFALSNCKTLIATADLGWAPTVRSVKMRAFLSPVFDNKQIASARVTAEVVGTPGEKVLDQCGVHYWYVTYDRDIECQWRFAQQ
ncbi:MAG: hypothetical protein H8E44_43985 [Planctomycetes bacterium]|nr:hypothetical protein [Planctomycetota bacterium]MBL7041623.1 hypothetical protein [Pirellulaceae bacterium]